MPLLALDFLAGVVTRRIDAGPPCMGPFLSSGFRARHIVLIGFFVRPGVPFLRPDPQYCKPTRAGSVKVGRRPNLAAYSALARPYLDSFEHDGMIGFFVRPGVPFLRPDPQYCKPTRAGAVKVGRRPNLAAYSALARPYLDSFEHDGTLSAVGMTIRGEPAFLGADQIAPRPCIRWVQDPNHDALMRIGGEAPGRRTHSFSRHESQGGRSGPATSNRHRHPLALEATGRSCRKISM